MTYYDEMIFHALPMEMRSKAIRRHLKLIWLEHVKRRPALIEEAKKDYIQTHERWCNGLPLSDPRRNVPPRLIPRISEWEQKIIDTPLDTLMEDFEKTLSPPL